MATAKSTTYPPQRQNRIIIERREQIAVIDEDPNGQDPMVVVAFQAAGRFLNGQAATGEDSPSSLSVVRLRGSSLLRRVHASV